MSRGLDQNFVDPDINGIYTKRKLSRLGKTTASQPAEPGTSESAEQEETENVPKFPAQNWGTSLKKLHFLRELKWTLTFQNQGKILLV